ncbi:sensor histidine kinase [Streptacidiphilus fuscans]|uniref:histidine kinase n=1 Tax=Streptacidiphilus fuscans TaxID=2789292 RepID=A0A931B504_9ACTN|nr:ATP-binding protein [Streptacidiphilus fuscans]MBF9068003.1 GHKL domain-containing protein [Streptacidiphilus fuscans]
MSELMTPLARKVRTATAAGLAALPPSLLASLLAVAWLRSRAAVDRLRRAAEEQRRFVADAAHELRSPIAALRTNLEVSLAHPEQTDWPVTTAQALTSVRRLQELAEDLLVLARPDDPDRHSELVDAGALARDLVADFRTTHPHRPAYALDVRDTARVLGNRSDLGRLLRNLLDNATRHAATRVELTVDVDRAAVEQEAEWVVLTVHNDGSDIPAEDRERIFERFTRLAESRSRDAGGSGLGLALARETAVRHGGSLSLTRSGPTFVLRLPVAAP